MKKILIGLLALSSISANADVLKAVGFSDQRVITIGLKVSAIRDAKHRLETQCLQRYSEIECANMKVELNQTKTITHRQCGGTIFGPEGRCTYVEAEVWGRI